MSHTLECPACWAEVDLDTTEAKVIDGDQYVACEECGSTWRVDPDADCEDGQWQDRTSLELPKWATREQRALVVVMRLALQVQRGGTITTDASTLRRIKEIAGIATPVTCPDCEGDGQVGMTIAGTPGLPLVCQRCGGKGKLNQKVGR